MPTNVHYNGSVEPIFTTFTFRGPAAEVARLLSELTERLGRIDAAAVDHEARVLAQEERVRGGGGLDSALAYRWGARGPGVFWFRQFGLNRPDPELLRAAAGRWFVRQNAALALDGPLPDGLRLSLPQGQAQPVRLPAPARWLPAAAPDDRAVVTGLAPSGLAAAITLGIVGSRLNRGLRTAGAPPDWSTDYLRLGDTAHLALMAPEGDGQAEHAAGAVGILQQVAGYGPAPAEVDEYRSLQEQLWLDRDATWSAPWQEAEARLLGRPRQTADSWRAELDAVAQPEVAALAHNWLNSLLVTVPERTQTPAGLPWLFDRDPGPNAAPGALITTPAMRDAEGSALHFDGRLLQQQTSAETLTIDLHDLALYGVNPDGQRLVIGGHGDRVVFEPGLWRQGARLQQALDSAAPASVTIPLEPRPADEVPHIPTGAERAGMLWRLIRTALTRGEVLYPAMLAVALVGVIVWLVLLGNTNAAAWLGFIAALIGAIVWMRTR